MRSTSEFDSSIHTSPVVGEVGVVVPTKIRFPGSASVTVIGDTLTVPVVAVLVPIPTKSIKSYVAAAPPSILTWLPAWIVDQVAALPLVVRYLPF